jgi:hypothetical protein
LRTGNGRRKKEDRKKDEQADNLKWTRHGPLLMIGDAGQQCQGQLLGSWRLAFSSQLECDAPGLSAYLD